MEFLWKTLVENFVSMGLALRRLIPIGLYKRLFTLDAICKLNVLFFLWLFVPVQAFASNWLVSGGLTAGLSYQALPSGGQVSTYQISGAAGLIVAPGLEFEVLANDLQESVSGTGTSSLELDFQLNWVFSGPSENGFYLGARIGELSSSSTTQESSLLYGINLGKRFEIIGGLTFDPNFSLVFIANNGIFAYPIYHLVPIQFTLFF